MRAINLFKFLIVRYRCEMNGRRISRLFALEIIGGIKISECQEWRMKNEEEEEEANFKLALSWKDPSTES